ncbi:hypothetical protein J6590_062051 [Homalodisca vitripennis]|nr:hypothetical protein J6590_062051 [Homalodisca vitripennis]
MDIGGIPVTVNIAVQCHKVRPFKVTINTGVEQTPAVAVPIRQYSGPLPDQTDSAEIFAAGLFPNSISSFSCFTL